MASSHRPHTSHQSANAIASLYRQIQTLNPYTRMFQPNPSFAFILGFMAMALKRKRFFEQAADGHQQQEKKKKKQKNEKSEKQQDKNIQSNAERKQNKTKVKKLTPEEQRLLIKAKVKPPAEDTKRLGKPKVGKYIRGKQIAVKGVRDKKLNSEVKRKEELYNKSALTAAKVEQWLLPSEGGTLVAEDGERTYEFTQEDIVREVDISSSHKAFDLKLPVLGPYSIDYNHTGRYALIGGRKGHLAMMDWRTSFLVMETQVKETTHDVKFLHNEQFFAAAQKKYIYIYDKKGAEVHCLKEHIAPLRLEFLRQHFLLASINKQGVLHYQDTSTGKIVANYNTRRGRCDVIRVNPYNGIVGLGHSNGTVTMWSPNVHTPLVTMLCHKGAVRSVAFDFGGYNMVTAGTDAKVNVWDVRKMRPLHEYQIFQPANSLDISQKGLLAVGSGATIEIWKNALRVKQEEPYMRHKLLKSTVQDMCFCPYEDVLGIGHSTGVSSILVPGSGEPNFDSFVANPFETVRQRHEAEVHALLEKLQPEMIMLDPQKVGTVKEKDLQQQAEDKDEEEEEDQSEPGTGKRKTKGRSKASNRVAKKQEAAYNAKRDKIRNEQKQQKQATTKKTFDEPLPRALARFA